MNPPRTSWSGTVQYRVEHVEHPTDVVLLDLGLPDAQGLQALRALRARACEPAAHGDGHGMSPALYAFIVRSRGGVSAAAIDHTEGRMTRTEALLVWLAAAGESGVTSAAIAQWAARRQWPPATTRTLLSRAVQRGHLAATPLGYQRTGQAIRLYRVRQRGAA